MVKQSPFQQDLFDLTYIEEQVATIKKSMDEANHNPSMNDTEENEQSIYELLQIQQLLLEDIQNQLEELNKTTNRKWWQF